jgi:hypothetical protein
MAKKNPIGLAFLSAYSFHRRISRASAHWYLFTVASYVTFSWVLLFIFMFFALMMSFLDMSPLSSVPRWLRLAIAVGGGGTLYYVVERCISAYRSGVPQSELDQLSGGRDVTILICISSTIALLLTMLYLVTAQP